MLELAGKVALVTGGSRGIGAAIAHKLARNGADVALTYLNSPTQAHDVVAAIKAIGQRGLAIKADNAKTSATTDAVDQTVAEFGRLDILVNNAGIFSWGLIDEVSPDELDRVLAINVKAVYVASQAAVAHMRAGSRIINIGSTLADRIPSPGLTLYAMSKAALNGFTQGLARDLGERGINANVVHPGPTDTAMNPADGPGAEGQRKLTALGRYNSPADIAAMVAYLAGPGGHTITGASFTVDAGTNA